MQLGINCTANYVHHTSYVIKHFNTSAQRNTQGYISHIPIVLPAKDTS